MPKGQSMRNTSDRIRHSVSFELIALFIVTPLGAWFFGMPVGEIGVVAIVSASIATGWNYLYNLFFDLGMLKYRASVRKTPSIRVVHALLFEASLLVLLLPFIAWYLDIGLVQAFWMDVSFAAFYLVYTFFFNWAYDIIFPIPDTIEPARQDSGQEREFPPQI